MGRHPVDDWPPIRHWSICDWVRRLRLLLDLRALPQTPISTLFETVVSGAAQPRSWAASFLEERASHDYADLLWEKRRLRSFQA